MNSRKIIPSFYNAEWEEEIFQDSLRCYKKDCNGENIHVENVEFLKGVDGNVLILHLRCELCGIYPLKWHGYKGNLHQTVGEYNK